MFRSFIILLVAAVLVLASESQADHRSYGYPRVRTFSGGYYGPTQAHYQYQRRYGRPWHGYGGFSSHHHYHGNQLTFGLPSLWSGFGSWGPSYYGYSSYSSFGFPAIGGYGYGAGCTGYPFGVGYVEPVLIPQSPAIYTPFLSSNPISNGALLQNGALWQQEVPDLLTPNVQTLGVAPIGKADVPLLPESSPEAQLRSLRFQQHADARLKNLDYLQAYLRYKDAIAAAGERPEPHYGMGIALAGMKRFDKAVKEFKTATQLDPTWVDSVTLLDLIGEDNLIGKMQLQQRAGEWALEDAYDADRMYLLGLLLHLDGDEERSRILLNTATALVGEEPHLVALLTPQASPSDLDGAPLGADVAKPIVPPAPDENAPFALPEVAEPPLPNDPATTSPQEGVELPKLIEPTLPTLKSPTGPVFPSRLD